MEEAFRKGQDEVIVVGNSSVVTGICWRHRLNRELREKVESHDEKARTFPRYEKTKFDVEKSKIMVFKKGGEGKEKSTNWKWKGERVDDVKEMLYLERKMQRNGDVTNHMKERMKRANVMMK